MFSLDNISMFFGSQEIFRDVSLIVNPRDRIGLVGRNGAGKTTMLKILAGMLDPTKGKVVTPPGTEVGYLPQQMRYNDSQSLWEEVMRAFDQVRNLENDIEALQTRIAEPGVSESQPELLDKFTELMHRFQVLGGQSYEAGVEQTVLGLGFKRSDFHRSTSEFSGGWRMRIELARILLGKPAILLLDEPTNHLDIESIEWLEKYLSNYEGAVVLISHDSKFLDTVTNRTVEISLGKLYDYDVAFSKFREIRAERREQQLATYRNQQKKIEDTEKFIERFRYKSTKAVQVQSRIKALERLDRVEIELEDVRSFNIKFPPAPRSGTLVVETKRMTKHFGEHCVFENIDLVIERGEKVAFVGKNGEGKTTFSRILVGELDFEGENRGGHNVSIGYFAQNQDQIMNENKTVFETIDDVAVGDIRSQTRSILGAFLFHGDDVHKKVRVLSGGERSRLALAQLLLKPYNLLILDEPTNHLDMRSKDILKHALLQYDGTLIVVSHDREFLDGLVEKVYEFGDRRVREHLGGVYDFLKKKRIKGFKEIEKKQQQKQQQKQASSEEKPAGNKKEYERRKAFDKKKRTLDKKIDGSEENIAKLEEEIGKLDIIIQESEKIEDQSIFTEYEKLKSELFQEMTKWEQVHMELEKLQERENK
ncbi:MAG TPA: ABC transporter ATP-binding protein [Bacteroides sp.]|nr:ABC transporter ATP-binding protein [Bacteroides sp.]